MHDACTAGVKSSTIVHVFVNNANEKNINIHFNFAYLIQSLNLVKVKQMPAKKTNQFETNSSSSVLVSKRTKSGIIKVSSIKQSKSMEYKVRSILSTILF